MDFSSDEEQDNAHYEQFFDPPSEEIEEETELLDDQHSKHHLSTHEKRQLRVCSISLMHSCDLSRGSTQLQEHIAEMEAENVAAKSWQMGGEVGGKERPLNSLLEETLEFDHMTRPPPLITDEVTHNLEDIIRQRIIDEVIPYLLSDTGRLVPFPSFRPGMTWNVR